MSNEDANEARAKDGSNDVRARVRNIDKNKLPLFYRIILKIPGANLIESASGAFWAICVPILVFLNILANLWLLIAFNFPINIILIAIVPTIVLILLIRISFERFINFWNLNFLKTSEWNVKRAVQEYTDLTRKKEDKQQP